MKQSVKQQIIAGTACPHCGAVRGEACERPGGGKAPRRKYAGRNAVHHQRIAHHVLAQQTNEPTDP